jgi:hypothetical protein
LGQGIKIVCCGLVKKKGVAIGNTFFFAIRNIINLLAFVFANFVRNR